MMGFTADGQSDSEMIKARDRRFGVDREEKRKNRADIVASAIDPHANGWQYGKTVQIADPTGSQHDFERAAAGGTSQTAPSENSRSEKPDN
jgi:hypothetical protein